MFETSGRSIIPPDAPIVSPSKIPVSLQLGLLCQAAQFSMLRACSVFVNLRLNLTQTRTAGKCVPTDESIVESLDSQTFRFCEGF